MRFIDEVSLQLCAGAGGQGAVSFRREPHVPHGGPDGGKGGRGGDIYLEATAALTTLLDLKARRIYKAKRGRNGSGNRRSGKAGEDLILRVPVGTQVHSEETEELLVDFSEEGQRVKIAAGGRGGQGNSRFATANRQAPSFSQEGTQGEDIHVQLTLKIIADVGLVGFPNAGKSTLIRAISASKARVADYPFTTLTPNLGVVSSSRLGSYVVADIPGLIEGAHEGAGLGHQFLRHVERTRLLVHIVSLAPDREPLVDAEAIERELRLYSEKLTKVHRVFVANKIDLIPRPEREAAVAPIRELAQRHRAPLCVVSCLTGEGLKVLQRLLEEGLVQIQPEPELSPDGWHPLDD
jgi:GTP-binding protein